MPAVLEKVHGAVPFPGASAEANDCLLYLRTCVRYCTETDVCTVYHINYQPLDLSSSSFNTYITFIFEGVVV